MFTLQNCRQAIEQCREPASSHVPDALVKGEKGRNGRFGRLHGIDLDLQRMGGKQPGRLRQPANRAQTPVKSGRRLRLDQPFPRSPGAPSWLSGRNRSPQFGAFPLLGGEVRPERLRQAFNGGLGCNMAATQSQGGQAPEGRIAQAAPLNNFSVIQPLQPAACEGLQGQTIGLAALDEHEGRIGCRLQESLKPEQQL